MEAHIHLPEHLAAHATLEAERLGLTLDDLILVAVHDFTEAPSDRRTRLLAKIGAYVARHYSLDDFPADVVLKVLRHIRSDDHLRMLYDAEIRDFYGNIDDHARASLNHAIGATVASRLQGEVSGHLEPLDPSTDLADSCVLLRPMRLEQPLPRNGAEKRGPEAGQPPAAKKVREAASQIVRASPLFPAPEWRRRQARKR